MNVCRPLSPHAASLLALQCMAPRDRLDLHPLGLTPFTPQIHEADLKPLSFASHAYPTFHLLMPLYSECGNALPAKFWGEVALHISSDSTPPHSLLNTACCMISNLKQHIPLVH